MSIVGIVEIVKRYPYGIDAQGVCQEVFGGVDSYNLKLTEQALINSPCLYEDGRWFVKGWMI